MNPLVRLGLALATSLVLTAPTFAQTAFDTVAASVRAQPLAFSPATSVVQLNPADQAQPRSVYDWTHTVAADGTITVAWKTGPWESTQVYRADGTLLKSRQSDATKKVVLEVDTDPGRTKLHTKITQDGQVKSDKTSALKPGIVVRDELQLLVVQAWQAGIRDGLKFQSYSPDGGMLGDFQVVFKTIDDPLSLTDKYSWPAEYKTVFAGKKGYVVADMSLQGVGAFFYPHHFYLVYQPSGKSLDWQGYFGEDPKNPVYQYLKK